MIGSTMYNKEDDDDLDYRTLSTQPSPTIADNEIINAVKSGKYQIKRITIQSYSRECAMLVPTAAIQWSDWHCADVALWHGRFIGTWIESVQAWQDSGGRPLSAAIVEMVISAPYVGITAR